MYTLKIETNNAAFADDLAGTVAGLLRYEADRLERNGGPCSGSVYDYNGNRVGAFILELGE